MGNITRNYVRNYLVFTLWVIFEPLEITHQRYVPLMRSTSGRRSFAFAAPPIWNGFPAQIHSYINIHILYCTYNSSVPLF